MIVTQEDHSTILKYKQTMKDCISLYYPNMKEKDLDTILDYSINKRYKEESAVLNNSYTNKKANTTLLQMVDYILDRQPITTAFGTRPLHTMSFSDTFQQDTIMSVIINQLSEPIQANGSDP